MQTSVLLYCGLVLNIVTVPTLDWGKGLVIARREEEGAVLLRVAIYSVSGGGPGWVPGRWRSDVTRGCLVL